MVATQDAALKLILKVKQYHPPITVQPLHWHPTYNILSLPQDIAFDNMTSHR